VNILFDQGLLGLGVLLLLIVVALWRTGRAARRNDELAPYWLAALLGFGVVGMFDSLTDVPRLAFLFYWVILYLVIHRCGHPRTARPAADAKAGVA
jgi:O-antigen ligase